MEVLPRLGVPLKKDLIGVRNGKALAGAKNGGLDSEPPVAS
jgi:hypothetical protein